MNNLPNQTGQVPVVPVMSAGRQLQWLPANQLIPVADASGQIRQVTAASVQWVGQLPQGTTVQVLTGDGQLQWLPANQLISVADANGQIRQVPAADVQWKGLTTQPPAPQPPAPQPQTVPVMDANGQLHQMPADQLIPVADPSGSINYVPARSVQWPDANATIQSESTVVPSPGATLAPASSAEATRVPFYTDYAAGQGDINEYAAVAQPIALAPAEPKSVFRKQCSRTGGTLLLYLLITTVVSVAVLGATLIPTLIQMFSDYTVTSAFSGGYSDTYDTVLDYFLNSEWAQNAMLWTLLATAIGALCASVFPFLGNAKRSGFKALSVFGKGKYVKGVIARGAVVGWACVITWSIAFALLSLLFPGTGIEESSFSLDFPAGNIWAMVLYVVYVCVIAPIFEEFMFRGVLLKGLSKYGIGFSVAITSILFGLLHGNLQQTPFAAAIGVILAYAAIRTGNIWSSIAIHFLINASSTLITILVSLFPDHETVISLSYLAVMLAAFVGAIVILAKNRKRIHWQPADPEVNSIIAPKVQTEVKCKFLTFFTRPWVVIFVLYCIFSILTTMGVIGY